MQPTALASIGLGRRLAVRARERDGKEKGRWLLVRIYGVNGGECRLAPLREGSYAVQGRRAHRLVWAVFSRADPPMTDK